jgi:hypothetical protein
MLLFPAENLIYRSRLSEGDVIIRLKENVGIYRPFKTATTPYVGKVDDKGFKIWRVITGRNSFLPQIAGHIKADLSGTKIEVKMRLHPVVGIFMIAWFGGVGFACAMTIWSWWQGEEFELTQLLTFVMIAFGVVLILVGFKPESTRAKKDLEKILDAELEE